MSQRASGRLGQFLLGLPLREGAICLALLAPTASFAQQNEDPQFRDLRQGVQNCATIADAAQRLACFDQLATDVNAAPDTFVVPVDPARVATIQRESFGFSLPNLSRLLPSISIGGGDTQELQSVEAQVARILSRGDGSHSFVMEDGQVWIQTDAARVPNVRAGDTVTIRRAALGSYMLIGSRGGVPHRVRREG